MHTRRAGAPRAPRAMRPSPPINLCVGVTRSCVGRRTRKHDRTSSLFIRTSSPRTSHRHRRDPAASVLTLKPPCFLSPIPAASPSEVFRLRGPCVLFPHRREGEETNRAPWRRRRACGSWRRRRLPEPISCGARRLGQFNDFKENAL